MNKQKKTILLGIMETNSMKNLKKKLERNWRKNKKLHHEEISDRIPILDVTLDKWQI